jgi:hypothetical protein
MRDRVFVVILGLAIVLSSLTGCQSWLNREQDAVTPKPVRMRLFQKGAYQAVYGSDGRLLRLLQDRNGDGTADVVVIYDDGDGGHAVQGEIDTDLDGRVDRWEVFGPDGALLRVGTSSRGDGRADVWQDGSSRGTPVSTK